MKKIVMFVIFLIIFSMINVKAEEVYFTNLETNYKVIYSDDANLLSETEKQDLLKYMVNLTSFGNIAFKTINDNPLSTQTYASNYYHELFSDESGTLFLIDMDNRYLYIFSDGKNYQIITNSKADIITDNVYKYATNQNYYLCAKVAYEQIYTLLSGGKIAEGMRHYSNFVIAITIAFTINFLLVLRFSRKKNKDNLKNYLINVNIGDIEAIKCGSHRVYHPPNDSSSGGGSSGGGSSGGGSSGGGGGHSF